MTSTFRWYVGAAEAPEARRALLATAVSLAAFPPAAETPANASGSQLFPRRVRGLIVGSPVPATAPYPPRSPPVPLALSRAAPALPRAALVACPPFAWLETLACEPPPDDACAPPELADPPPCEPPPDDPPPCEPPADEPPPLLCACAGMIGIEIAEKIRNAAEAKNATSRDVFLMAASLLLLLTLATSTRLLSVAARALNPLRWCLYLPGKCGTDRNQDAAQRRAIFARPASFLFFALWAGCAINVPPNRLGVGAGGGPASDAGSCRHRPQGQSKRRREQRQEPCREQLFRWSSQNSFQQTQHPNEWIPQRGIARNRLRRTARGARRGSNRASAR